MTLPGWGQKVLLLAIIPVPQNCAETIEALDIEWTPYEELQSAYKPLQNTETALMRVQHDIAGSTISRPYVHFI